MPFIKDYDGQLRPRKGVNMTKRVLLLIATLLPVAVAAQETNLRAGAVLLGSHNAGYENPIYGGEAGASVNLGRIVFDGSGRYLFAKKIPGGGHNVAGQAAARIQFNKWFAGPVVSFDRQTTNAYSKSAFAAGAEAGRRVGAFIISGNFLQDLTSENKRRNYGFKAEWYSKGKCGPYLAARANLADFSCFQTDHCTSANVSVTAGFHFKP